MKIFVKIKGGIGNQLFCYAAARRLAIVNNGELILDNITGFSSDYFYERTYQLDKFNIKCKTFENLRKYQILLRLLIFSIKKLSNILPKKMKILISERSMDFDESIINLELKNCVYMDGYWQSENYFTDISEIIRDDFKIQSPTDDLNLSLHQKVIKSNAVALHVRFFEEISNEGKNNIGLSYYYEAIRLMETLVDSAHYFIFSDKPALVKKYINLPKGRVTFISHNNANEKAYCDLWLMSSCKYFIIANSTFSWWGAWLSDFADKIVIAPSMLINSDQTRWGFSGNIPDSWIKI